MKPDHFSVFYSNALEQLIICFVNRTKYLQLLS